jgi:adenine-specific DNA-methyltransferase
MKNIMTNEIKKVKDDLIVEIDKRIVDKIIEKTNAGLLKKLITNAETINEAIMIAELGTTYKRTGFHFDKRLEKITDTIKYFKKNEKLSFVQDKKALTHKLVIGDNYDALLNLLIEYRGQIDVIYIDPPYGKDSMGEFAKMNYENAITRDNLLSMLYPRLVLARQLLSDNGVIFCSIDDKNQAYVKGLLDEVFWESNVAGSFIVIRAEGGGLAKQMVIGHDYVHTYAKDKFNFTPLGKEKDIRGKIVDKNGEKFWIETDWLRKEFGKYGTCLYSEIEKYHGTKKKQEIDAGIKKGDYVLVINSKNEQIVGRYRKVADDTSKFYTILRHLNKTGTEDLEELGLDKFDYPKPVSLIKELVSGATIKNKNAIILDFFAGSGTTGQAVLELNKQDEGERRFILATLNEITDITPNGIVNDVTSKRLKRVMTSECYDGTKDFKWNEKNKSLGDNLDVYDIGAVANFEGTKDKTPFDVIDETLYGQKKLGVNEKIKWVCENFEGTQKTLKDK